MESPADAIRVVWPNGVPQEVIEPVPNQVFTEIQILKGSCPFLATSNDDGSWEFVTDLLWRSPLGLKINSQTVPPIAATQDWVKVRSDQLHSRNGIYELAITAQLWETHFIDEIKMIAIDHPIGTEILSTNDSLLLYPLLINSTHTTTFKLLSAQPTKMAVTYLILLIFEMVIDLVDSRKDLTKGLVKITM